MFRKLLKALKDFFIPPPALWKSKPMLKDGSRGPDVVQLQGILKNNGFNDVIDGVFGAKTRSAVIHFQQTHNGPDKQPLQVDGIVGPTTWWALYHPSDDEQIKAAPVQNAPTGGIAKNPTGTGITTNPERNKVLAMCQTQLGVREIPNGTNTGGEVTKFHKFVGMGPIPWCMAAGSWITFHALGRIPWKNGKRHAGCKLFWEGLTLEERILVTDPDYKPRPGDGFVMVHPDGTGHFGILAAVRSDGKLLVYEGNSANRYRLVQRIPGRDDHKGYANWYGDRRQKVSFKLGFPDGKGETSGLLVTR